MAKRKVFAKKESQPGRLRIVAGKWRSRLLPIPEQRGLRPTSARVRETLFNWLSAGIRGRHCLDPFAGTGALSFEALSRGAASATMIEKSPDAAKILQHSAKLLAADDARIECADAMAYLDRPADRQYDIIFLDPPFADDLVEECCQLLHSNGWLADQATVYIEQEKSRSPPSLPDGWTPGQEKTAGNVRFALVYTGADAAQRSNR